MTNAKPLAGVQTVYDRNGDVLLSGAWESKNLFRAVSGGNPSYWQGRRILDIGSNSSGLSVELARAGASVVAAEPDPYKNSRAPALPFLEQIIKDEELDLTLSDGGLFDAHKLGSFDTVLCLGLIYHFRDQQYVLDYLSTLDMKDLVISNQTHPGDQLAMYNRLDPSVLPAKFWENYKEPISGWHPTRPLFERMMQFAGFTNVIALTDETVSFPKKPLEGITNSAYYRATKDRESDPETSRRQYYPR
tara:strand:+ start:561 stop:1301 length:741 start_codon:yes stop_codon:yes gene_type:complete